MRVAHACAMRLGNTRALWCGRAHRANCALAARHPALHLGSEGRASEHALDLRLGAFLRIGIGAAHAYLAQPSGCTTLSGIAALVTAFLI